MIDTTQKPGDTKTEMNNPIGAVPQTAKKFRTPYGVRDREVLDFPENCPDSQSKTQQHMAAECDIHNILRRYEETGVLSHVAQNQGLYEDFSQVSDFQSAMEIVLRGQEQFEALPSHIRDRFGNSAEAFLGFMNDPRNLDEAVKLGLAEKLEKVDPKASQAPQKAPAATEGTPDGASGAPAVTK